MDRSEDLDDIFGESSAAEDFEPVVNNRKSPNDNSSESSLSDSSDQEVDEKLESMKTVNSSITLASKHVPEKNELIPYLLKLPGFIGYDSRLFNGKNTLEEEFGDYYSSETLNQGDLLRSKTTIRSRKRKQRGDGSEELESNTRLNRWSDGSWTLQIGQEQFEVLPQTFGQEENNFLFQRHPQEGCMEASSKMAYKLTIRPFMDALGSHRKYLALADAAGKGMKVTRVKVAATTADPEQERLRKIRDEREKIKANRKREDKRRNLNQNLYERAGKEGLSAAFLEEEYEDEDNDEYEADFIDDEEIAENQSSENEGDESYESEEEVNDEERKETSSKARPTSRVIFDEDDD